MAIAVLAGIRAAMAAGPLPLPGLGEGQRRLPVDPRSPPWPAVARLQIPGTARCTAVLLAPRLAVTAAHCLYAPRLGGWVQAGAVHVLAGYAAGSFLRHATALSYRIAPGFDPRDTAATRGADLAVVTLAAAMPDTLALAGDPPPGTPVLLGGYNQDRAEVIVADRHCAITGRRADPGGRPLLLHDCAGTRGTSGGPLLVQAPDGTPLLAGLQVAARGDAAGGVAIPAASIHRMLAQP
ncbi:Trypsin-like serine protease [Rhodovastum atsumiense]|nr:Trypsin-like serine protease [Rhodovastum atsumiense]